MTRNPRESLPAQLLDFLISASEGNPFVHACLVGDGHLLDPLWTVSRQPLALYEAYGWAYKVDATPEQRKAAVAWAEARVGQKYGLLELLAEGARLDLHIMPRAWYTWRPKDVVCSAFCTGAYMDAGPRITYDPLPTPASVGFSPLLIGPRPWEPPSGGSSA